MRLAEVFMRPKRKIPEDYRPSDDEPFMNERQRAYFRRKLLAWQEEIQRSTKETLRHLQDESAQHADIARLAAGAGVEHRAIEHDPLCPARQHRAGRRTQPGIVEKQPVRHAASHSLRSASRLAASHSRPIVVTELVIAPSSAAAVARAAGQTRTRMSSCSSAMPAWPAMPAPARLGSRRFTPRHQCVHHPTCSLSRKRRSQAGRPDYRWRYPGASLFGGFGSLFSRFNSLFARLGNWP